MAPCPRVRERKRRHVCDGRDKLLDLGDPHRLPLGPGRDLADLVGETVKIVLTDVLDEQRTRVGLGFHARLPEAPRDPGDATLLRDLVQQHITGLRAGLGERGVLLHLQPDHREHAAWCGCREIGRNRLHIGCLPASRRRAVVLLLGAVDLGDDDEPSVAEETARVAQRDHVGAGQLEGGNNLDRFGHEPGAQALHSGLDLGAIATRDQVGGLQRRPFAHGPTVLDAPFGPTGSARPTRARSAHSRLSGTPPGRPSHAVRQACRPEDDRIRCTQPPRSRRRGA